MKHFGGMTTPELESSFNYKLGNISAFLSIFFKKKDKDITTEADQERYTELKRKTLHNCRLTLKVAKYHIAVHLFPLLQ